MTPEDSARLWSKVDRRGPDECWPWLGGTRQKEGYGILSIRRKKMTVSRLIVAEQTGEDVPAGRVVRHTCDNPPCCNPAHLVVGTPRDNSRDAMDRDRVARGERVAGAILTAEQVRAMREYADEHPDALLPDLGERFDIDPKRLSPILMGKAWKHAGGPLRGAIRRAKLTEADAEYIRTTTDTYEQIRARLDVSRETIARIRKGRAWRNDGVERLPGKPDSGIPAAPVSRRRATDTHCANGHEWTPETIYTWNGVRMCRACRTARRQR